MTRPERIQVGYIAAAHGIRGQVKIRSLTNPPKAIFSYNPLSNEAGNKQFTIQRSGGTEDLLIAVVEGITDRNQAELLKGTALYAHANLLPDEAPQKLIGLEAQLPQGGIYGKVIAVHNYGAGDIIEIEKTDGKNELLPVDKRFVEIKKDRVLVMPPEWLSDQDE